MNQKQQLAHVLQQWIPYADAFKLLVEDISFLGDLEASLDSAKRSQEHLISQHQRLTDQVAEARRQLRVAQDQIERASAESQALIAVHKAKAQEEATAIVSKAQAEAMECKRLALETATAQEAAKNKVSAAKEELERIRTEIAQLKARIG